MATPEADGRLIGRSCRRYVWYMTPMSNLSNFGEFWRKARMGMRLAQSVYVK